MRSSLALITCCLLVLATAEFTYKSRRLQTVSDGPVSDDPCHPDQVHLSLGDAYYNSLATDLNSTVGITKNSNATAFIVWQTKNECKNDTYIVITSDVLEAPLTITGDQLWHDSVDLNISAKQNGGTDGHYASFSHTALLFVEPGHIYTYTVYQTGDTNPRGSYTINLPPVDSNREKTRFAVYGDIDHKKQNTTLDYLVKHDENTEFIDMHLCGGDLAYDIYTENGTRGEDFFNAVEPALATWPFMITPGNHEWYQNYTFLNFRTRMPLYNLSNNHYYSFNLGKIHFVAVDTFFWIDNYGTGSDVSQNMYDWIANDLDLAVKNRDKRPWIIVYSHRPIYCSFNDPDDEDKKRCYSMYGGQEIWDELYHKHQVDMVMQAHVHYWERTGPVYQNKSAPFAFWSEETRNTSIINPSAPVYTVEGAGGNHYFMVENAGPLADYAINSNTGIGVSIIETVNDTALYYKHVNALDGSITDHFYMLKGDEYPSPTFSNNSTNGGGSKAWLIALILVVLAAFIGLIVYRRYRTKQVDELQEAINYENTEVVR